MDISEFSVEDFVLHREFRIWVLYPDRNSNILWRSLLEENPSQVTKAKMARALILNLSYDKQSLSEMEVSQLWDLIDAETDDLESKSDECEVIPISAVSILDEYDKQQRPFSRYSQWLGVSAILVLAFALGISLSIIFPESTPIDIPKIVTYEEYTTPPGVKSTMTLQDGSKVMLNSGSSIRFIKNFEADQRVLYLTGEGYFEVAKDSLRPFSVITEGVKTTALGTAFNVSAYADEEVNVSLVEGKVALEVNGADLPQISLEKGEDLRFDAETGLLKKGQFDTELVLAWTKKRIIFQQVNMMEAIRILENWYGVTFTLKNKPKSDLLVYGMYEDEILENVLEGLSYTARFDYKIDQDEVEITFK